MDPMGYKVLANFLELSLIPFAASSLQLGVFFFFQKHNEKKLHLKVPEGPKFCLEVFFWFGSQLIYSRCSLISIFQLVPGGYKITS